MFKKGLAIMAGVLALTAKNASAAGPASADPDVHADPVTAKIIAEGHDFHWPGPIYAMGDIHSDARNALTMLYKAGIIDEKGHWIGGNTFLIQIGDIVDRGPDTRLLYAFFRRLREEAAAAGGHVHNLLGNHDVMQVCTTLNYVHPQDFDSYGSPSGRFFAFSALGEDGQDIRAWDTAIMVNQTLFVHAGVAPEYTSLGIQGLNDKMRHKMVNCNDQWANAERGPVWNRVYSMSPEPVACPELAEALTSLGADRMVVGHTIQDNGVRLRCSGRLVLADTGASRFINNTPTLVKFEDIGRDSKAPAGAEEGQGPSGRMTELALDLQDLARVILQRQKEGKTGGELEAVKEGVKITTRALVPPVNGAPWKAWVEKAKENAKKNDRVWRM